jgi:hypothetical protein
VTVDQAAEFTRVKSRRIREGVPSPATSFTRVNHIMVESVESFESFESLERARIRPMNNRVRRDLDEPGAYGYNIVITGGET